ARCPWWCRTIPPRATSSTSSPGSESAKALRCRRADRRAPPTRPCSSLGSVRGRRRTSSLPGLLLLFLEEGDVRLAAVVVDVGDRERAIEPPGQADGIPEPVLAIP